MRAKIHVHYAFWIIIFLFPLLSAGCFDNSTSPSTDVGSEIITIKKVPIQINVPKAWREVLEADYNLLGNDVIMAYSSLLYTNGFANNISITKENLTQPFSSIQYADANIVNSAKYTDDYLKIDEKEVILKNDDDTDLKTKIHIFEARFDMGEKTRKYLQLYATQGTTGYTLTIAISIEESDLTKFENLLTSFRFVKE